MPVGEHGAGQIAATAFSVPAGALDAWRDRLAAAGFAPEDGAPRFAECPLVVRDPSGLVIELVSSPTIPGRRGPAGVWRRPWPFVDCTA